MIQYLLLAQSILWFLAAGLTSFLGFWSLGGVLVGPARTRPGIGIGVTVEKTGQVQYAWLAIIAQLCRSQNAENVPFGAQTTATYGGGIRTPSRTLVYS